MKLVFFRHGYAGKKNKNHTQMEDFTRGLTKSGLIEVKEMVQSCRYLFKGINSIFTSPLVRTVHTAQLLYREYPHCDFEFMPSLDKLCEPQVFVSDLKELSPKKAYCFVGHEPHLSSVINLLLNGTSHSEIILDKAGILVLEGKSLSELKLSALVSPKLITKFRF